jgi:hypothetical protein
MSESKRRSFFLSFETVREFDQAFEREDGQTGIFFPSVQASVGQQACIRAVIEGLPAPIYLEGVVAWRRLRPGGRSLPPGVFVNLTDRDRRLNGIIDYFATQTVGKERRRNNRFPMFASAPYTTAQGEYPSEVRNISEGGVFMRCMGPLLSVGASFPVTLFLEGDNSRGVSLTGRVAWLDMFQNSKGMGIVFEQGQSGQRQVSKAIKRIKKDLKRLSQ